ncbi:MAG: protein YgfX [Burkholderiales bacterium]
MRTPPAVHVRLGPSRLAGIGIGALAIATLAVVLALPVAAWQQSAATVALAVWAWTAFRGVALRQGTGVVRALTLAHDRMLIVCRGDGALVAGHVRSATYVGSLLTSIVWRPDDARWSRAVLVLPDMLPAEDFRRLRVLLRYSRSDVIDGAPASHA